MFSFVDTIEMKWSVKEELMVSNFKDSREFKKFKWPADSGTLFRILNPEF